MAVAISLSLGAVLAAIVFWVEVEAERASVNVSDAWIIRYMEMRNTRVDDLVQRVSRLERLLMEKGK